MQPEVAEAIPRLVGQRLLPAEAAPRLLRVARGELVSVRAEVRVVLYASVLLVVTGVGLLVREHLDRIGPVAVASAIGLAAAAALAWAAGVAPAFSWGEVASPHLAFDYVLLLGVLLAAADLAYVEVQFTPLGAQWSWHLLIVACGAALAAFRYDSRVAFSLALSSFAAWRGVSVSLTDGSLRALAADAVRANALLCGLAFVALGVVLAWRGWKAHFESVAASLGWLLALVALADWQLESDTVAVPVAFATLPIGAALAAWSFRGGRFGRLALGVLAVYFSLSRLVLAVLDDEVPVLAWFTVSSLALVALLVLVHRRIRGRA
jgi:hypothetical protein